ncbi:hypothetical protein [Microbulbifer magnicolonia]|uniref:hypothetical protein n=1 Tax=Microbulbifer magnicolonia TaxID=3109744 RepID=UPI002B41540B|nr:hypothetical protein [Microbulbifer sp. GG15]
MKNIRIITLCLASAIGITLSGNVLGQTSVIEVDAVKRQTDLPQVTPGALRDLKKYRDHHWDFEDGTLQGFRHEDATGGGATGAFHGQPTFGDNVSSARALNTASMRLPENPCAGLVLDAATECEFNQGSTHYYLKQLRNDLNRLSADLQRVGGGYANTAFPIGKEGLYWIGTYENRPSRRILSDSVPGRFAPRPQPWGTTQGDRLTGRLVSTEIELQHKYFHFLVGGGCSKNVGVYLQSRVPRLNNAERTSVGAPLAGVSVTGGTAGRGVLPTTKPTSTPTITTEWKTLSDASGRPIAARGFCIENMVRVSFDIGHLSGTKARILIEDKDSGGWGHINVDDIWISNRPAKPNRRDTDPVFGVADLHAHLMNEEAFMSYPADGRQPDARGLWGSALGPISALGACNDIHTTSGNGFVRPHETHFHADYTMCRDMCLNLIEGAGLPEKDGDQTHQSPGLGGYHNTQGGYPSFVNWPMWYSAIHQQMHWEWVKRAHAGGVRMMIASVGNSEVIAYGLTKEKDRPFTSDQDAIAKQIPAIKRFARENSDWAEVAYTPRQARRIINSGKLAIIIGVEVDHVMDSCDANVTRERHHVAREYAHPDLWASRNGMDIGLVGSAVGVAQFLGGATRTMHYAGHPKSCSPEQIEARLDALYRAGVRQITPIHFSDSMLGGYAINGALFTASAIFGDPDARPPKFMALEELERTYGDRVHPPEPVEREAYYGENKRRLEEWRNTLPFSLQLNEVNIPIWAKLEPHAIADGNVMPEGIGRTVAEFFAGQCVEDEGWRIAFGFLTAGASEATCAATTLNNEMFEAARSTMPFEGATDSALMIPLELSDKQKKLPFHINSRSLTANGQDFLNCYDAARHVD